MTVTTDAAEWEDLLSAALLGTDRRTPPGADGRADAATALLDAAAVATVRRRAGLRPATAAQRPVPAAADPRPPLPPAAARRLALLLNDRAGGASGGGRRGTAPNLAELLPQWLAAANAYGYRAPASLLPALLDAGRARTDLRAGRADARRAAGVVARGAESGVEVRAAGREPQRGGERGRRSAGGPAAVGGGAVRRAGGAAGRAAGARAVGRAGAAGRHLGAGAGRGPAAVPRLVADRAVRRRRAVPRTGAHRPQPQRAGDRGRAAVRAARFRTRRVAWAHGPDCVSLAGALGRTGVGPRIAVEAPHDCDAGDGAGRRGRRRRRPGGGERAWWLGQLVEAAPLDVLVRRGSGGRSAAQIVALPVADDWQSDLHAAWCRAAVRQRDAEWARALLGPPPTTSGAGGAGR